MLISIFSCNLFPWLNNKKKETKIFKLNKLFRKLHTHNDVHMYILMLKMQRSKFLTPTYTFIRIKNFHISINSGDLCVRT